MGTDKKLCAICAWRKDCQKRFITASETFLNVHCPDYTRDVTLRDLASPDDNVPARGSKEWMDQLVNEQLTRWRQRMKDGGEAPKKRGLVITVSREAGSGGSRVARKLSLDLDMDLIGGQIIRHVAESAKMSRKVIESLDEKEVTLRDAWLAALFDAKHLWPDQYLQHLTKVIGTIGRYGNAIIMGRGAHYILPRDTTFRVRIIAPLEQRITETMRHYGYTAEVAEDYVIKTEAARRAFHRKYFHADVSDSSQYDIVVNTRIGIAGAAEAVKDGFCAWREYMARTENDQAASAVVR